MTSGNTNNLKPDKQTEKANSRSDSTMNEISYGPGIVQKLCARFLQLSKESNTVPPLRSPRFKRRKSLMENKFTVISEVRRCNVQTFTTSKLTAESNMNVSDENKGDLTFVPTMKLADPVEVNGPYLYHAALISGDRKANRKARKIESIREKFEKISATPCILPLKELNKIRSRRNSGLSVVNNESKGREIELVRKAKHNEVFEVERNDEDIELAGLKSTIGLSTKLLLHDDNLISSNFSSVSGVSSLPNIEEMSDTAKTDDESGGGPLKKAQFQFEVISSSSCATCTASSTANITSVEIPAKKKGEENGLQEVHRLLKKFTIIREQRAKKRLYQDLTDKTDDHSGTVNNSDLLMQCFSRVPVPHLHSASNSNLHFPYTEKKDRLKKTNLSNGITLLESVPSEVQGPHSEETNDHAKVQGEMQDNRTVAIASPVRVTDGKCVTTELETNNKLLEVVTDGIKSKSEETTILRDADQVNPTYTHNWETHRKSLTAMYLEKKNLGKKENLMNELREQLHNSESESTAIAKDEGPVRQSLLSLVKDEDVPELMEAMAEKLEFVFEDLTPSVSGAGEGILRSTAKRARPRVRETKLEFHSSSPTVFTYPDEESAVEKAQWDEGKQITYSLYRELCERKKEHSELSVHENHELQNPLRPSPATSSTEVPFVRTVTLMEEPSMAESLLGVTGRISYNNVPLSLSRFNENTVSLIASK